MIEARRPWASYLITFRDDGDGRLPLLGAVLNWLARLDALEVIVVEQDGESVAADLPRGPNTRFEFVFNDGPFNKAWGLNVAARNASCEILVTGDADMLMEDEALLRAVNACSERFDAVNPYTGLVDLTATETTALVRGDIGITDIRRERVRDRLDEGELICFCGGICAYRREVYFALGGLDEEFVGWGGEDDAMSVNLGRYTDRLAVQQHTRAFHLWHPRSPDRYNHRHYEANRSLAAAYRTMDDRTLAGRRERQQRFMGNPDRYRAMPPA